MVRPSFTLGGTGSASPTTARNSTSWSPAGWTQSPVTEVLIEESVLGWKEYEMEVMRDVDDNVVIICSIENFDPMGVHTGDSITVAPAQTLTDKEYQRMRDASLAVIREIGVETGGSNIQFAIHPDDGPDGRHRDEPARQPLQCAWPRRRPAFRSPRSPPSWPSATGCTNCPTTSPARRRPASSRRSTTWSPRSRGSPSRSSPRPTPTLTTQMKSVGETMAIGRTFKESFQKALRGLEVGSFGFGCDGKDLWGTPEQPSRRRDPRQAGHARRPSGSGISATRCKYGMSIEEIYELTGIDPWFLDNLLEIVELEDELRGQSAISTTSTTRCLRKAKQFGFSDRQLATIWNTTEMDVRAERKRRGIVATFKSVDTCAAEFEAYTPYYYSTYEDEDETPPKKPGQRRIMILGGGPNRIGQGIEFDYCCCHASFALRELGIESIMVNSNPETVSTDYDTSDLLFFEPLTTEDVLNICDRIQPDGVIVQFGGQTPLNLARALANAGVPIIGTSVDTIEDAEDREKFSNLLQRLDLKQPANGIARTMDQARAEAAKIGYPGAGAAQFRAGRPGDGDLLRRGPVRAVRRRGVHRRPGPAGADRPLPGRRHRGRRRRHRRRRAT